YHAFAPKAATPDTRVAPEEWKQFIGQMDAWIAARPDSATAHLARTSALLAGGLANSNTSKLKGEANLWNTFLRKAKQEINQAGPLEGKDPEFYHAKLELARLWGMAPDVYEATFRKAVQSEPEYFNYYFNKSVWLQKKESGPTWEQFAA